MSQQQQQNRLLSLANGRAMVVTDLHGDWEAYQRCRERFILGHNQGELDFIIFCGDLIHRESSPDDDSSWRMLQDVRSWQAEATGQVIYLLGNHELAHIYRIDLRKGNVRYTPRLAAAMGPDRPDFLRYLQTLPFYVRTGAGVAIAHTGAAPQMLDPANWQIVSQLDHQAAWDQTANKLSPALRRQIRQHLEQALQQSYTQLMQESWQVTDPDDPFYDDIVIAQAFQHEPLFELLWECFFNQNERDYGHAYEGLVEQFLALLSQGFVSQRFLVTGHIPCFQGYERVNRFQLRLASSAHAQPREGGKILILDLAKPVFQLNQLEEQLQNLF